MNDRHGETAREVSINMDMANIPKDRYRRGFVLVLTLVFAGLFFAMIKYFFIPVVLALVFSGISRPLYSWLKKKFGGRESAAAFVTLTMTTLMVLVPVILLLGMVALVPEVSAKDGDWEFAAGLYGWLPTINGSITTEVPGLEGDIQVDPSELLENLSFTLMGTVVAKRNDWGVYVDAIYLKETKSTDQVIDIGEGVNLHTDFTLNSWILNFGGLNQVAKTPSGSTFNVLLGARYFSARSTQHLKADGPLATDETVEVPADVWNGIIGASGRIALGKNWYIPLLLDGGAGDSDFTWQGMGGVGYEFKWGGLALAYRYLDFDQETENSYENMNFGGGELGIYFRF